MSGVNDFICFHYVVQMTKAASTVESLEKLGSNYYRTRYLRKRKLGYTGDMTVNNIWLKASEGRTNNNVQ